MVHTVTRVSAFSHYKYRTMPLLQSAFSFVLAVLVFRVPGKAICNESEADSRCSAVVCGGPSLATGTVRMLVRSL